MNLINYQDSRPIYEQITERYKVLILKGVLAPDEQGFLYSVRGKGSFVRGGSDIHQQKRTELAGRLARLLQEAKDVGIDPEDLLAEAGWTK